MRYTWIGLAANARKRCRNSVDAVRRFQSGLLHVGSALVLCGRRVLSWLLLAGLVIALGMILSDLSRRDWRKATTIISSLAVPDELVRIGYSSSTLTRHLIDRIVLMKESAGRTEMTYAPDLGWDVPDIEVKAAGISVTGLRQWFRGLLASTVVNVSGDVVMASGDVLLTIRVSGLGSTTERGRIEELDQKLLLNGARYVVERTEPLVAAFYYFNRSEDEAALAFVVNSLTTDPPRYHARAHTLWAHIADRRGDQEGREEHFRRATELAPGNSLIRYNWGWIWVTHRRYAEALGEFRKAVALAPTAGKPHFGLALALCELRQFDEAQAEFERAAKLMPLNAQLYDEWGLCLSRRSRHEGGRHEDALVMFRKSIELDHACSACYEHEGSELYLAGDKEGAKARFEKAVRLDDKNAHAYLMWGDALAEEGDNTGAIEKWTKVVEIGRGGFEAEQARKHIEALKRGERPGVQDAFGTT